ncbi:MAG: glycosyltransferase family 2 protein [Anaerolineales bacterium]|nr:glycosyltransferase family 2 protein [Anaerolineales bacterium]
MDISVIVTAYNIAAYLGEALASVLAQTYPAAEVIVLDDGSTDEGATARVAQGFGARVRYVYQPNAGIGAARNAGAAAARGSHLAWLDGDDYWEPEKLATQVAALKADPTLEAAFCYIRQFISPDIAGTPAAAGLQAPLEAMPGRCASTLLLTRPAWERTGLFATGVAVSEFLDWYARAGEAGVRMVMTPEALAWRRIHAGNNSRRRSQEIREYAQILKAALDRRRAAGKAGDPANGGG